MSSDGNNRSEPSVLDDVQQNIEPQQSEAEHTKLVDDYLQRLFGDTSVHEDREADHVETRDTYISPEKAPEAAQPVRSEQPPVQELKKPVPAPENSELIAKMRDLANSSTTTALTAYRSKVGSRILFQIATIVVLLVTALLLFEFSQPAHFSVYVAGLACWLVALVLCAKLPQSIP